MFVCVTMQYLYLFVCYHVVHICCVLPCKHAMCVTCTCFCVTILYIVCYHVSMQCHSRFISDPQKQQSSFNTVHLLKSNNLRETIFPHIVLFQKYLRWSPLFGWIVCVKIEFMSWSTDFIGWSVIMLKVSKLIGHCTTVLMNMMMTIADMNGDDVTHCCLTNQLIKALGIQLSSHLVFGDCDITN